MARSARRNDQLFRRPSWWVVVISGTLLAVFVVAIVRELINGHQVRQQVSRLEKQVATAETHQRQLRDLIDYLQSPTFQEQEARLQLGLKKNGEQVIVVPTTNGNVNNGTGSDSTRLDGQATGSHPSLWWSYFFDSRTTTSS